MATVIRSLALSILLASASTALGGRMVFAPLGNPSSWPEYPQRALRLEFSVFRNGELIDSPFRGRDIAANYALDVDTGELTLTPEGFTSNQGAISRNYNERYLNMAIGGSSAGFGINTDWYVNTLLVAHSGVNIPFPSIWDEPATVASIEDLGNNTYVAHGIDGPWHNPDLTVFDGLVNGEHFLIQLERFGYFPIDSLTLGVPEPATLTVLGVSFVWIILYQFTRSSLLNPVGLSSMMNSKST